MHMSETIFVPLLCVIELLVRKQNRVGQCVGEGRKAGREEGLVSFLHLTSLYSRKTKINLHY